MGKKLEITGQRFGRLLVLIGEESINSHSVWRCLCDCGTILDVVGSKLTTGHTKSCGCFCIDKTKEANTKHGRHGSKLYKIWAGMKRRCLNENELCFPRYGGRGIGICKEWMDFENFHKDMGKGYADGLQIDRVDNHGDYSKQNCRWATRKQNARNTRSNVLVFAKGKLQCVAAWAEELGVKKEALYYRVNAGWNDEKIINTPVRPLSPKS